MNFNAKSILYSYFLAVFLSVVILLYYMIGGEFFPDYHVYKKISDGVINHNYITEFVSGYLLAGEGVEFLGFNKLDSFVAIVQIFSVFVLLFFCFFFPKYSYSILVFSTIYGALLLTTTLRAAPLHVVFLGFCIFFCRYGISYFSIVLFTLIGMLFHDSFILCTLAFLLYKIFFFISRYKLCVLLIKSLFYLIPIFFITGGAIKDFIVQLSGFEFLGARRAYLDADLASISKLLYCLVIYFLSYLSVSESERSNCFSFNVLFLLTSFNLVFCLLFIVNNVAAIRFSIFVLTVILILRGGLFFQLEKKLVNGIMFVPFYLALGFFQFYLLL